MSDKPTAARSSVCAYCSIESFPSGASTLPRPRSMGACDLPAETNAPIMELAIGVDESLQAGNDGGETIARNIGAPVNDNASGLRRVGLAQGGPRPSGIRGAKTNSCSNLWPWSRK